MGTAASVKEVSGKGEAVGIIPSSIKSIFAAMQQSRTDYDVTMKVSHLTVNAALEINCCCCLQGCTCADESYIKSSCIDLAGSLMVIGNGDIDDSL